MMAHLHAERSEKQSLILVEIVCSAWLIVSASTWSVLNRHSKLMGIHMMIIKSEWEMKLYWLS